MNPAPPSRKQHLLAVAVRLSEMLAIALVGPLMRAGSNQELSGGPEQAPGVAGLTFLVGIGAALLYGTLASVAHFLLRRKAVRLILLVDAILAAGFVLSLVAA